MIHSLLHITTGRKVMADQSTYIRAKDIKPGAKVKLGQLRFIYEIFIILSNVEYNNSHDETTGTVEFIGKEITPEVFSIINNKDYMCYMKGFDERESFDSDELNLLFECSEL